MNWSNEIIPLLTFSWIISVRKKNSKLTNMFKYTVVIFAVIACAVAKPAPGLLHAPLAYSAPLVAAAPGVVTATSSQVIARNYNGIATAPVFAAPVAKYVAAPLPLAAAPLAAKYVASPYASPFAYSAPLAAASLGYAASYGYASPLSYASAPLLL
ncbi:cuticle protein 16.5-like isoform X2 [Episyrphus balteatus]|uniref:cuticle protein 16.5-like isoform X2 n=1 Tax=Episyrphus balteatus TaxID=286459 RepID=UPI0024867A56|nr:cuticle protein 16.5-like isoform X2 [Episyrphus balteatus]